MSIISDALQKAQRKKDRDPRQKPRTVAHPFEKTPPRATTPSRRRRTSLVLWVLLFLATVAFMAFGPIAEMRTYVGSGFGAISSRFSASASSTASKPLEELDAIPGAKPLLPLAAAPLIEGQRRSHSLTLSGIVFGAGKPFAVIDNQIVEVGDDVNGWEVIKIEESKVLLLSGEQEELTLNLK